MNHPAVAGPEDVQVRAQMTPNPFALKFVVNQALKSEGKATFNTPLECENLPLVHTLFSLVGVKQVHLFQNTLTVTHTGQMDDEELREQVTSVIKTRMAIHDPSFAADSAGSQTSQQNIVKDRSHLSPELLQIEEILDRTIRPGLQSDGGDVEVLEFKDNILKILYQGACGGCPSSMMGTLDAIQNILQHETGNQEIRVVPV